MNYRMEDEKFNQIAPVDEETFWSKKKHWHLLDGFTVDGNPASAPKANTYLAYWNMIKNGQKSGLNGKMRRRRTSDGRRIMRHSHRRRRRRSRRATQELHINELLDKRSRRKKDSYVRFQNNLGQVLIADHKIHDGQNKERINYEFAVDQKTFATIEEANAFKVCFL